MGSCASKPEKVVEEDPTVSGSVADDDHPQLSVTGQQEESVVETTPLHKEERNSNPACSLHEVFGGLGSRRGSWQGDEALLERFTKVTTLARSILGCQIADIVLLEEERSRWEDYSHHQEVVAETGGMDPRLLLPVDTDYVVINDFEKEPEYMDHPCVVGEPHVRYFCGTWIKARDSTGRKHGILFVSDVKPKSGDSTNDIVCLMRELGELLAGEIEKSELEVVQHMIRERQSQERQSSVSSGRRLLSPGSRNMSSRSSRASEESFTTLCAAADCFHGGVMVLESVLTEKSDACWKVLYMNEHLAHAMNVSDPSTVIERDIWESFSVNTDDRSAAYRHMKNHAAFEMSLTLQNRYHPNPDTFIFEFRPASVAPYANEPQSPKKQSSVDRYYFAIARTPGQGQIVLPGGHRHSPLLLSRDAPTVFKDIRLGPMIGRGAYGRVYRGNWNGNIVAVKVITSDTRRRSLGDGQAMHMEDISVKSLGMHEAAISTALSHPNVVHTYQYSVRHVEVSQRRETAFSGKETSLERKSIDGTLPKTPMTEIWLISEFCNRGPLLTAIENGLFLIKPNEPHGQPNLIFILQTLQEISAAMEYLHSHDIVHGDLTGGNVLITTSDKDGRGFTAKVVDFGLSRICEGGALKTSKMGCAEYMPPELITGGLLTKSGDVYAFGVILWELYNGKRAWGGMKPVEVLEKVARHEVLTFGEQTPRRLKILGEKCMSPHPKQRPDFSDIVFEVNSILSDTMSILQKFLGATSITPQRP